MLELVRIKTSGVYDPFAFSSISAKSTNLAKTGQLSPGDYRIHWYVVNSVTSSSGAASLDFDLTFGSARRAGFTVDSLEGPVEVFGPDGKMVDFNKKGGMSFSEYYTIRTGPGGHITLGFPDGSALAIGENSQLIEMQGFDREYYSTSSESSTPRIFSVLQGYFVWMSGLIQKNEPPIIKTPVGGIGPRGTKFELLLRPDHSGHIKLWEGAVEWRPKNGDPPVMLAPGQMITFDSAGRASAPVPVR
jgi:hypothetical protein